MFAVKGKGAALIIACAVFLSGVFGFAGTYLANTLTGDTGQYEASVDGGGLPRESVDFGEILTLTSAAQDAQRDGLTITEIAALTADSVVEIITETVRTGGMMRQFISEGAGSGVIITGDGYIATNNHVIDGAGKITVRLRNGTEYNAVLTGRDVKTDLAVVKIEASELPAAIYGDSDALQVGNLAVAIGNPLGELGGSVTEGIISAKSREIVIDGESMTLLQTSAAINPGNSGGGLFNAHGELIGIVNAKSSGSGIEGLGFAIPVNTAKSVIESLITYGYVPGRVNMGVTLIDINDTRTALIYRVQSAGVYVLEAEADSTLKAGDRIISVNGREISSAQEVKLIAEGCKVGDTLTIVAYRGNSRLELGLKLKQASY